MFLAERLDLVLAQPEAREHAPVIGNEIEPVGIALAAEFVGEVLADCQHGLAHLGEFFLPHRAQALVGENDADDRRAMVRREGIVHAVQHRHVTGYNGMLVGGIAHRHRAADTVAVQAEIL